jgi:hypothetical protein
MIAPMLENATWQHPLKGWGGDPGFNVRSGAHWNVLACARRLAVMALLLLWKWIAERRLNSTTALLQ